MTKRPAIILGTVTLLVTILGSMNLAQKPAQAPAATPQKNTTKPLVNVAAKPPVANIPTGMPVENQQALVKQYCSGCHNDKTKSGGMTLTALDLARPEAN